MTAKHPLPEDWQPTPGDMAYGQSRGFCETQLLEIAESFRAYWLNGPGAGRKWKQWSGGSGAWGQWLRKETPWPAWKVEKAEPVEKLPPPIERPEPEPQTLFDARRIPKPRLRKMPGPLTYEQREAMKRQILDAPPARPKQKIEPRHASREQAARQWARLKEAGAPIPEFAEQMLGKVKP